MYKTSVAALLLMLFAGSLVQAQQSDYEIKKEFENRVSEIEKAIGETKSVSDTDSLLIAIDELALDFADHAELLDYALYPESYSSTIASLKSNARAAEYKLLIIENQAERLQMLSQEVSAYRTEIGNLTKRADSLRLAIARSQKSEARLARLVREYRESVEKRDEFIFDVVDSLFITYKELSPSAVEELARQQKEGGGKIADNPLSMISAIIRQNIETLKASGNSLNIEDYLRMYALQRKVDEAWNQIGDELVVIYGADNRNGWKNEIRQDLKDWKATVSHSMWASLDDYMEAQGVDIGAFDNSESFFRSLDAFVSESTAQSDENILTSTAYDEFKVFSEFWTSKVMDEWNRYLVEGDVLTASQIAAIDTKVDDWRDRSKPVSGALIVLFGIGIIAVVGFIVAMVKR